MFAFSKHMRILRAKEFKNTLNDGCKVVCNYFVVFVHERIEHDEMGLRLGLIVSKKAAKLAVKRNKIKRKIRECFRLSRERFQVEFPRHDIVIIARSAAANASSKELASSFETCLEKLRGKLKKNIKKCLREQIDLETMCRHWCKVS
jgi:ribonuclease P protein component